jgi:hypothetical protein
MGKLTWREQGYLYLHGDVLAPADDLLQSVNFYQSDAGSIVFAAHYPGIGPWSQGRDDCRFAVVGWGHGCIDDLLLLAGAPVVVRDDRGSGTIV